MMNIIRLGKPHVIAQVDAKACGAEAPSKPESTAVAARTRMREQADPRRERLITPCGAAIPEEGVGDNVSIDDTIVAGGSRRRPTPGSAASRVCSRRWSVRMLRCYARHRHRCRRHARGTADRDRPLVHRYDFDAADHGIPPARWCRSVAPFRRGRLFFESGPVSACAIVARWIERHQKEGRLIDEDLYQLAVLFHDMLIGEHQLGWLMGMPRSATARADRGDRSCRGRACSSAA